MKALLYPKKINYNSLLIIIFCLFSFTDFTAIAVFRKQEIKNTCA